MPTTVMIDNWTLQDIGRCLSTGLPNGEVSELVVHPNNRKHSFRQVNASGVNIEMLVGFLGDIVLRDSILVDQKFSGIWANYQRFFSSVEKDALMRPVDFLVRAEELRGPTKAVVDSLCVTSSLKRMQKENEESFKTFGSTKHPYESQVIWGTAGMLSRSHVFEVPYYGHPMRRRVMEQVFSPTWKSDATREVMNWIASERLRLYEGERTGGTVRWASLYLPLVVIEVVNNSSDIDQLIPTAVQLRDKYRELREWLRAVQAAMDTEDVKEILRFKKTLATVSKDIARASKGGEDADVSVDIGMSGFGASMKVFNAASILSRFGPSKSSDPCSAWRTGHSKIAKTFRRGENSSWVGGVRVLAFAQ
jgi:hypothetical protein